MPKMPANRRCQATTDKSTMNFGNFAGTSTPMNFSLYIEFSTASQLKVISPICSSSLLVCHKLRKNHNERKQVTFLAHVSFAARVTFVRVPFAVPESDNSDRETKQNLNILSALIFSCQGKSSIFVVQPNTFRFATFGYISATYVSKNKVNNKFKQSEQFLDTSCAQCLIPWVKLLQWLAFDRTSWLNIRKRNLCIGKKRHTYVRI